MLDQWRIQKKFVLKIYFKKSLILLELCIILNQTLKYFLQ